jgi:hypothetical protein
MAKAKPADTATSVFSASGKPKNFRIVHEGMAFPAGSVVPRGLFGNPESHLHIGSIVETTDPVNVEVPGSLLNTQPKSSTATTTDKGDAALREDLAKLAGQNSVLATKVDELTEQVAELELNLEVITAERDKLAAELAFLKQVDLEKHPEKTPPIQVQ